MQTIEEFREAGKVFLQYAGKPADVSSQELLVPARDGYQLKARLFNADLPEDTPTFIMFPGCGYMLDLFESNAVAASRIAKHAEIKVVIVNFRLVPEYPLLTCLNDGYDAVVYLVKHASELNLNFDRLIIGGMSSGGHCAAAISNKNKATKELNIQLQVLISGCFDLTESYHEYDAYEAQDKLCNAESKAYLFSHYGLTQEEFTKPIYSPYFDTNLVDTPKTVFIVGEYDGVRNHTEAYYAKMKNAGCDVEKIVLPGQTHNTFIMREVFSDGVDPAEIAADVIKKSLSR